MERNLQASSAITRRKAEHIDICLQKDVAGRGIDSGWGNYRFVHKALPEIRFADISTATQFLGKPLQTPLLVSSMTGGTEEAWQLNRLLAEAAEAHGWALGLGSMRAALEHPETARTFCVRQWAPSIPILANLGAVQLNYGVSIDDCRQLVQMAEADGLVLHLNPMQEIFQPDGDTDFAGLLAKIEQLCRQLEVPVGVKEVGMGIDADTARQLADAGAAFIDTAGAGGTSWIRVEGYRSPEPVKRQAAEAFGDWGLSAADSLIQVRRALPAMTIAASGGIQNGVDAAKALALGANLSGTGRALLKAAAESEHKLDETMARFTFELKAAMFGIGAAALGELQATDRLIHRSD
ncbi:type 2 isopentenyl-diphosphate Delta-isomerase [Xylanibacillus composti]|uniref:Isopentenyl-diphosphate delta-isomerase n=1 Tax=Xylanibacillus composti TaxID=1572762 RepID=A0A8J4H7U1_9BACL|nr:type 2 isopentenyl-diphosphate Delta-isomerase [Xylanibacillus composti]MDT9724595.1 type 2 isopentenyl-diphosphate Delta-isomerase [Xylanibacillus composti]GIQ71500.1 isopentenyl-diphosphate delta-isomerase [Xylanibacillus composti]